MSGFGSSGSGGSGGAGDASAANQTSGAQKTQIHGPLKGTTVAADATVSTVDSDHNALDVYVRGGGSSSTLTTASKGTTTTGSPTSTDVDVNRTALDVWVRGGGTSGGALETTQQSVLTSVSSIDGKLVAAATLADGASLPSTTKIGSVNLFYNGTTVDLARSGVTAATSTFTGMQDILPVGKYNATLPTLSDGQGIAAQVDSRGILRVAEQYSPQAVDDTAGVYWVQHKATPTSTNAWSIASSTSGGAGTAGVVIKSSAGRIRRVIVVNTGTSAYFYAMIHNKATAPVNSDVPVTRRAVMFRSGTDQTPNDTVIDFGPDGLYLSAGISISFSTAAGSVTLLASADAHYSVEYL